MIGKQQAKVFKALQKSTAQLKEIFGHKTLILDQEEFLALHEKTTHCVLMQELQTLATKEQQPQILALCPRPVCPGWLFGKAYKRPWR